MNLIPYSVLQATAETRIQLAFPIVVIGSVTNGSGPDQHRSLNDYRRFLFVIFTSQMSYKVAVLPTEPCNANISPEAKTQVSCKSLPFCLRHQAATHRSRNSAAGAQSIEEDVMKSKFVVSLFAFLALLAGVAQAQDHSRVDIFAGYSYDRWDGAKNFNLNGGSASVAYNVNNWLSGVADFGGYHNGNVLNSGSEFTLSTYLFGPRFSYRHWNRITPFGEVLFGAERVSTSTATSSRSDNGFAMTAGGGFDVKLAKHFSVRPVKVDYLLTRFAAAGADPQSQKNLRVSTGVVFNF
jgi:hypothetical protein